MILFKIVLRIYKSNNGATGNNCLNLHFIMFTLAGGTEYVAHEVNENNAIEGKARCAGSVSVSEERIYNKMQRRIN